MPAVETLTPERWVWPHRRPCRQTQREKIEIEIATEFYAVGKIGREVIVMDEIHKASPQGHAGLAKARRSGATVLFMTATLPEWTATDFARRSCGLCDRRWG